MEVESVTMTQPQSHVDQQNLLSVYQQRLEDGRLFEDAAQKLLIAKLYKLQQELEIWVLRSSTQFFRKIFRQDYTDAPPKGLYLYGDVGRGKSMLMDLFYQTSSVAKKQRVHFHAFMAEIHERLHAFRGSNHGDSAKDPLPKIAAQMAGDTRLFCFDEMQITNIADAMILSRFFEEFFKLNIVVVATSNTAPEDLYKDGLQRESFEPFIEILQDNVATVELPAKHDYRRLHLELLGTLYFTPLNDQAKDFAIKAFDDLTGGAFPEVTVLPVKGRYLELPLTAGGVLMASFAQLCEQPLGAEDYLAIAREFSTVILTDIHELVPEQRNEARRFIHLIDALYEHKVKLICTAEVSPDELYTHGNDSETFARTASRLMEMQTERYQTDSHTL